MIAKVKISPVEHWCAVGKEAARRAEYVAAQAGHYVEIETESMTNDITPPFCGGREWNVTKNSQQALVDAGLLFTTPDRARMRICEHRLEMD